jgi:uncharacterized protein (TIGR00369 family)
MRYLDKIRACVPDANPFFTLMGIEVCEIGEGKASLRMEARRDMANGVGWMQGGIFMALADEAMALALCTVLADDEGIATISENTSFFKGVRAGPLVAEGRVIRKGRRVAFAEERVGSGTGRRASPGRCLLRVEKENGSLRSFFSGTVRQRFSDK